jgi:hypothetical protein
MPLLPLSPELSVNTPESLPPGKFKMNQSSFISEHIRQFSETMALVFLHQHTLALYLMTHWKIWRFVALSILSIALHLRFDV